MTIPRPFSRRIHDDLEILATPPKQFEEVTLDEDDDDAADVGKETSSNPSKVTAPSPGKSCNEQRENGEIPNVSSSGEIETESRLSGGDIGKKSLAENISKTGAENISGIGNKSVAESISKREKVVRGIQEALAIRQKSDEFPKKSTKELLSIGKKIEKCLFRQFEDVGKKYLAKYRSIVQNIRNPQNQVLFRRILQSKISARELVAMNTSDYAQSTGLEQSREDQKRRELSAIASDEVARRSLSGKVLVKSNQGEREVEALVKDTLGPDLDELSLLRQLGVEK